MGGLQLPLTTDISLWQETGILEDLPVPAAIVSREYIVVYANKEFTATFGPWEGKTCCEVYHKQAGPCEERGCHEAFESKAVTTSKGTGVTQAGRNIQYSNFSIPLVSPGGEVPFVLEICIEHSTADILRGEYQSFFDLVPCHIVVIDKELRVIDANRMVRRVYGDIEGQSCYCALKSSENACSDCTARKAFSTRSAQQGHHIWTTRSGRKFHYQVTAVPIEDKLGNIIAIIEMGVDITELIQLRQQDELQNQMLASIIENSLRGIVVITDTGEIPVLNTHLAKLLGLPPIGIASPDELFSLLPDNVNKTIASGVDKFHFNELLLFPERGEDAIPVTLHGVRLRHGVKPLGLYLAFHDLRQIKALERGKVEAERMAAVGQTVSGLAHGVKNLVTALEGGMYMLTSGMQGGKAERIAQGIDMLGRNIQRMEGFVKSFLHFARGREIKPRMSDPARVAVEVTEQYRVKAQQHGVLLELEIEPDVPQASIDYESMHECLSNFVGNAVDACIMAPDEKCCSIHVEFREQDGILIYEVRDTGCGMDDTTKKKIFSNFFTTKGEGGTGIGLLMTKKLVQEHGGYIEVESELGKGSMFRICLPRIRLPLPLPPVETTSEEDLETDADLDEELERELKEELDAELKQ